MAFREVLLPGLVLGVLAVSGVWLALKFLPEKWKPPGDAQLDEMVAGLLIIFAFVVGLTVTLQTSTLTNATTAADNDANSVAELYWYSYALSGPEQARLQAELRNYANVVVRDEWPLLGRHHTSPTATAAAATVRFDILNFRPKTSAEQAVYPSMLSEVATMFASRRTRDNIATTGGVPPILFQGIIALSMITLGVIPLSGRLRRTGEYAVYGVFAVFVFATLFFLADLDNPYAGTVAVKPSAFNSLYTGTFREVP